MNDITFNLITALEFHGSQELAIPMEAYMRNKFKYFGLKAPLRKEVLKKYFIQKNFEDKAKLKEIILELWADPHRECQYCAVEMARASIKLFNIEDLSFFEYLIVTKSWWDTVDHIAPNIIGPILLKLPMDKRRTYSNEWILSDNLWLQRTSLIFQLFYKIDTDFALLTDNILATLENKDFFIRKAAGWALRQHSRMNKYAVIQFIEDYKDVLSPLTMKEGLRLLEGK